MNEKKEFLDNLVKKFETPDFIPDDPIKFPYMFDNYEDQEIAALIASAFAYGKREKIIESVEKILKIMELKPYDFALNYNYEKDRELFKDFIYRYNSGKDLALLIAAISSILKEYKSLKNAFLEGFSQDDINIKPALTRFVEIIRDFLPAQEHTKGIYFLIPSPKQGSGCKRLNMFLRWMVRPKPVDFHLWKEISPNKLIIPLDVHVARLSRKLHLTARKVDDWKTAEEITQSLKEFDPEDPVKYDFALFGLGISGEIYKLF